MELLSKVADLVFSPLFNFVTHQMTYPFKAGDNMRDLEIATQNLLAKKDDLMEKVETAERNGQKRTRQFQRWLEEVDNIKEEADVVAEKYKQSGKLFFKCFSPNCCSNYSLSKKAEEKLLQVNRLLNDERAQEVPITPAPRPVQEVPVPPTFGPSNLEEALRYIKEEQVGMIGIWGMGGVGKTHLLKQINQSFIDDSTFDVVIFVTASQSCTVGKLQSEIAKNQSLMESKTVIFNFLRKISFLLLVDDLWARINLEKVGIPLPLGVIDGCKRKVVLTSRSSDVCGQMEASKTIKLKYLNNDDALNLFLEKVGKETINSDPNIRSLARDIVNELGGLPLALITIGRAMNQKKKPNEWEYAIEQLKKSQLHELEYSQEEGDDSERTFYRLKFSFDNLNSETLKKCFLSCSMWPEDQRILKDDLIRCWMGLGLIDDFDNIWNAYNRRDNLIGTLTRACLLEEDDEDDRVVSVHDLLRDMALWIARDNGESKNKWVVIEGEVPRNKKIWHVAERIAIRYTDIEKLPPPVADDPSELTTLMLQANKSLKQLRDLRAFVALTYLDLSDCGFRKFPKKVCMLVQLQYLNLAENFITSLPEELGFLVNLKFLILRDNYVLIIPQGVIAKLKYLQVLDLFNTPDETLTYLPSPLFEELESLNDLKGLGICLQDTSQIRRLIELDNMPIWSLGISRLNGSTSFSASFLTNEKIQKNLHYLRFRGSNVNQLVIERGHQHRICDHPKLEYLILDSMQFLEEIIWEGVVPKELFKGLRSLDVECCDKLKDISWVLHLPNLRELRVTQCKGMNQLIASEADDDSTLPSLASCR